MIKRTSHIIINVYEKLQTCYEDTYDIKSKRKEIVNENGWYVSVEEKKEKDERGYLVSRFYYYLVRKNNLVTE